MLSWLDDFISLVKKLYPKEEHYPLHRPLFDESEKKYLINCVDSGYVSSVGQDVTAFEKDLAQFTGSGYAVAVTNGTVGLHLSLVSLGIGAGDMVLIPNLTFIATANSVSHAKATVGLIDINPETLGLCPEALESFLLHQCREEQGKMIEKKTGAVVKAVIVMHCFGLSAQTQQILEVCEKYRLILIEDGAESLGSFDVQGRHTGSVGRVGMISFNGNKIITTGGGGMLLTQDEQLANRLKHLSTTGKKPHPYFFDHDEVAYNYRMPNLNAALGRAQFLKLNLFLEKKRHVAKIYQDFFINHGVHFFNEPKGTRSNFWLNTIKLSNQAERDQFLELTNKKNIFTRAAWNLMSQTKMYTHCSRHDLAISEEMAPCLVNLPSSVPLEES